MFSSIQSIKYEVKINNWLNKNIETDSGKLIYENDSFSNNNDSFSNNNEQQDETRSEQNIERCYELYLYAHYVEYFTNKLLEYLDKNNYEIYNVNQFRDDLIKFIYKYSYDE